jgi:hypothetical protein
MADILFNLRKDPANALKQIKPTNPILKVSNASERRRVARVQLSERFEDQRLIAHIDVLFLCRMSSSPFQRRSAAV